MSECERQANLEHQSQRLLDGPLKHVRGAALAVALLPLASVGVSAVEPAPCPSGGVCGTVFYDENNNGVQDSGEPGIEGAVVTIGSTVLSTDSTGFFGIFVEPGTYDVAVQIPPDMQPSPTDAGGDDGQLQQRHALRAAPRLAERGAGSERARPRFPAASTRARRTAP
jgi:hypothetical protein